jgi:hypothetical protein
VCTVCVVCVYVHVCASVARETKCVLTDCVARLIHVRGLEDYYGAENHVDVQHDLVEFADPPFGT